jgi:hypothetical protein
MQTPENVFEGLKLRCIAAGLLRAGQHVDCKEHGAELHRADENEQAEDDDYQEQGLEPKESVESTKEKVRLATAPFQCCGLASFRMGGTKYRHLWSIRKRLLQLVPRLVVWCRWTKHGTPA